ncbi:MAG: hypothetical protein KAJ19_26100 [Gammaproteobacteria bacterium]|nr:hypothetical protein [Gammaproteobacteria bacterium]
MSIKRIVKWQEIESAPKGPMLLLFSPDFIDEDFNPSGVVDGYWNDDAGWCCWQWNGCQDCYMTVEGQGPTMWAEKTNPQIGPDAISEAINRISELSDRNSPDDWPDGMIVTASELRGIFEDLAT